MRVVSMLQVVLMLVMVRPLGAARLTAATLEGLAPEPIEPQAATAPVQVF